MGKKTRVDLEALAAAISNTIINFAQTQEKDILTTPEFIPKKKRGRPAKIKKDYVNENDLQKGEWAVMWDGKSFGFYKNKEEAIIDCKKRLEPDDFNCLEFLEVIDQPDYFHIDNKGKDQGGFRYSYGKRVMDHGNFLREEHEQFLKDNPIRESEWQILNEPTKPTNPTKSYIAPAKAKHIITDGKAVAKVENFEIRKRPNKFIDNGTLAIGDKVPPHLYPERSERREPVQKMKFKCDNCGRDWEDYPANVPQAFTRFGGREDNDRPAVKCENCVTIGINTRKNNPYYE